MKKPICCLLTTVLLLTLLAACGGNDNAAGNSTAGSTAQQSSASPSRSAANSQQAESEERVIELNPAVLLYEDENITVELSGFFERMMDNMLDKCLTLKVTNNSDRKLLCSFQDLYIGDESVRTVLIDGNLGPMPGKSKELSFVIEQNTKPDPTPVENLEDLFHMEGMLDISIFSADGESIENSYEPMIAINVDA